MSKGCEDEADPAMTAALGPIRLRCRQKKEANHKLYKTRAQGQCVRGQDPVVSGHDVGSEKQGIQDNKKSRSDQKIAAYESKHTSLSVFTPIDFDARHRGRLHNVGRPMTSCAAS